MTAGEIATFGGLLRRFRKAASLTQEELAERTGLSRRGVNGLERGARLIPCEDAVALLADALSLAGDDHTAFFATARRPVPVSAPVAAPAPVATPTAMPAQQVRSTLPGGTVTFLFTDIEGSIRLLQRLGPAYAAALGEEAWAAAFAAGRALSLEGAIAEALEFEPGHEQQSPHDDGRRYARNVNCSRHTRRYVTIRLSPKTLFKKDMQKIAPMRLTRRGPRGKLAC